MAELAWSGCTAVDVRVITATASGKVAEDIAQVLYSHELRYFPRVSTLGKAFGG